MLIAFREAKCRNVKELQKAYALLLGGTLSTTSIPPRPSKPQKPHALLSGGEMQQFCDKESYVFQLQDGLRPINIKHPDSNSGIRFRLCKQHIEIHQLHVTASRRGTGLSGDLMSPLIKFAQAKKIRRFFLTSANDSFWQHMKEKHRKILWDIRWKVDADHDEEFLRFYHKPVAPLDDDTSTGTYYNINHYLQK